MKRTLQIFALVSAIIAAQYAQAQTREQARVKAVFILNFIKYSDHQAANSATEFVVGVYQDEELAEELAKICGNSYHGKKVVVRQLAALSSPVHLLFVPEKKHNSYLTFVKKNGMLPNTLIVTDNNIETTMIGFEMHDNKFYFRINEELLVKNKIKLAESLRVIAIKNQPPTKG
jgi:hypothetical protein